ncbi:MAG: FG-GAP-like repeat-containing protein [Acidobacteriota bacterium]|nr:FG-GAP-like repeat-containing protein [Acidobacteriota bacterium]
MKYKKATHGCANFLKGVSTLDLMKKNVQIFLLLLTITALNNLVFGGHSILDAIDPTFNPQIQTNSFGLKSVVNITPQPDGKILVSGFFNSYNRQPVGSLIRLNADATLDASFDNNVLAAGTYATGIVLQPDGKIIINGLNLTLNGQTTPTDPVIRLNQNGTVDTTFDFDAGASSFVIATAIDASGRILVSGHFPEPGVTLSRKLIRLNPDGTIDSSFRYTATNTIDRFTMQNNKVIFGAMGFVRRLNEDGSADDSFTPKNLHAFPLRKIIVQPDNKILVLDDRNLQRLNENGGNDANFAAPIARENGNMHLAADGRITVAMGLGTGVQIRRFLPNGTADTSFSPFTPPTLLSSGLLADGSVLVGDNLIGSTGTTIYNEFLRVLPNGIRDSSFNAGGIGFQTINPGSVRTIVVQPNGKVLIGGKFDAVNDINRFKIARLNADSTLDASFQINTNPAGNYFTQIREVYHSVVQSDGKIIVSGNFNYLLNGVAKTNVVRLNADGSIDATFNLSVFIPEYYSINRAGTNKLALFGDGKLLIGASRNFLTEAAVPFKLTTTGEKDTTFNPPANAAQSSVYIYDAAIQPDGKILIAGRYRSVSNLTKSFIARLNADGSLDSTFQNGEDTDKEISAFALLSNGKILIVKGNPSFMSVQRSNVFRLNADGSQDNSFNAGTGADGRINAILALPTGRIFLGGRFANFNNQPRQNLALLDAGGNLEPTAYNVNQEVLSLAVDGEGRVLVGGSFTTINVGGGQNHNRSYLARLIDSPQATGRTRFDFDGDGKADLGVFDNATSNWSYLSSLFQELKSMRFGLNGDKIAPADYDGDGKTDIAVYRPSNGVWYLMQSTAGFTAYQWGAAEDKPFPADYDGDGKADAAVWRPSNGIWYILQSSGQYASYRFGAAGDIPVPADYDGDGKTDVAVWRPSNGTFYWLASATGNQFKGVQFGTLGDVPAVADYNGDGKDDLVVFRPSNGVWYQNLTAQNGGYTFAVIQFGQNGDEPVAADYDGDGKADVAVRRRGIWYLLRSGQGFAGLSFGGVETQAVAALPNQ